MTENRAGPEGELCLAALQGHQSAAQRSLDVHPLPWSGVMQGKEDEERELEEGTVCVSQTRDPSLSPQDTGELAGGWRVQRPADFSSSCGHH